MNLFNSLVVCGASLTLLDCGGKSQISVEGESQGGGIGAGGNEELGGTPAAAGAVAAAGTSPGAGTSGSQPWQQWECGPDDSANCVPSGLSSQQASAVELQHPCAVNPQRPRDAADCAPPRVFACLLAVLDNVTILNVDDKYAGIDLCAVSA